jgi:TRAP-type C4-dicarboxylate transport system permease small subunit
MDILDRVLDLIAKTMKIIAAVLLFMLSIFILVEVLARAVNIPITGLKEIVANSIVIIAFLQLPYTIRIGGMLRAGVIESLIGPRSAEVILRLAYVLGAVLFGLVAYAGWTPMLRAWASGEYEGEGGFRVVTYPVRIIIVLGGVLGALNFLMLAIRGAPPLEATGEAHP